ncbi:imidazoleglycerol-phosphate dehydratase HisB [Helicovermis profundi]|uniref:Imidazoleglycerol-phosphate dehydratase n=1 Tax=Helicovermis profundi TaxID=3065157 RepID=A0AAU9E251_9FIRM|nr:imidazoleglycerol-phosphate dehydratase HisB [Clostridia bacterium S502]
MRKYNLKRKTNETDINISINLDGKGASNIDTGVGFLDHMLISFSKHSNIDIDLSCKGDLYVDTHHTVEDIGITLGKSLKETLKNKEGIKRFSNSFVAMDEALLQSTVDISGRGFLVFDYVFQTSKVGNFETETLKEFLYALAINAEITLHINIIYGINAHHIIEGIFKSLALTLKEAVSIDSKVYGIPSSKGVI